MDEEKKETKPETKTNLTISKRGFEPTNLDEAWRFAQALATSSIVPIAYQGKPSDCLIAIDLALRFDAPWLAIMQHVYTIHGKPAMDAVLCMALVNRSNQFEPIEYEVVGSNVNDPDYRVRAYATRKNTEKVLYGPWIDWKLVKAEGWYEKPGSKWKSMPEQMFHYRAAIWFQRRYCPELTMGMITTDEVYEMPETKQIESSVVDKPKGVEGVKERLKNKQDAPQAAKVESPANMSVEEEIGQLLKPAQTPPVDMPPFDEFEPTPNKNTEQAEKPKRGRPAKAKAEVPQEYLYLCQNCGHKFDEPHIVGAGVNQKPGCPKCFSLKLVNVEDINANAAAKI